MSPPTYYDIAYQINPWMTSLGSVQSDAANTQWKKLYQAIDQHATVVTTIPTEHPDIVFTANAGLVRGREVILSSFKFKQRQIEEPYWQTLFESKGYTTHSLTDVSFEGAGDALFAGDKLIGGYGFRTDKAAYDQIKTIWNTPIHTVELVDERFYHLDTCLCVLDETTIMYYPAAFSEASQRVLEQTFATIHVSETEALRFACNAVVLGSHVILPQGTPETTKKLTDIGYHVSSLAMDEFLKSGGAAKCLTLAI